MNIKIYFETHKQVDLARALGVTQGAVRQWAVGLSRPSFERCVDVERLTGGAVTCEELRPDLADRLAYLRGTARAPEQPAAPDIPAAAAGQEA